MLITTSAGGVGSVAVQPAKCKGAHVILTESENSFSTIKELGVDEIVDYKNELIEDKVTEKVELIFDLSLLVLMK